MAGATGDLAQRAAMYHHLYDHSGRNHGFPLLAAHGALWASGYFGRGLRAARLMAMAHKPLDPPARSILLAAVASFAETFRDINRRVCIETLYIYWLCGEPLCRQLAETLVPATLLAEMDRCHWARNNHRRLDPGERRSLFEAFFRWEQSAIVGPSVTAAFAAFDWRPIRFLALRPTIRFAFFGRVGITFRDFSNEGERIENGVRAFLLAECAGWDKVEKSLAEYQLLPTTFFRNPSSFVEAHRPRHRPALLPA